MKRTGRFLLLAALGCSAEFAQGQVIEHPLGGLVEGYKDAIRLRIEMDRVRALNEESAARTEAIRAQTEQLRRQEAMPGIFQGAHLSDSDWTAGMFNGRGWRKIDQPMKIGFAVGYDNALYVLEEKGQDLFPPATYGEVVTALDRFYEKPENAALPIMMGLRAFSLKVKGSSDAHIEAEMAAARKMVSDAVAQAASK